MVTIEQNQLKDVYFVVGKLALEYKNVENARKRLISVTLRGQTNKFVVVSYVKKLEKNAKCQIVAEKTKSRTNHSLVCSIK